MTHDNDGPGSLASGRTKINKLGIADRGSPCQGFVQVTSNVE
jgi:hypothetical protein